MMSDLFWLSDAAWSAIEPHLPKNQPGARRVDDRRVISGILHVLKAGCRWRDVPIEYGPAKTIYNICGKATTMASSAGFSTRALGRLWPHRFGGRRDPLVPSGHRLRIQRAARNRVFSCKAWISAQSRGFVKALPRHLL